MTASSDHELKVYPDAQRQQRQREGFDEWIEESHRQVMVNGFDFADHEDDGLTIGTRARTTDEWAAIYRVPVLSGVIRRIKYANRETRALLVPLEPSLLAADGVWFDIKDLERDA